MTGERGGDETRSREGNLEARPTDFGSFNVEELRQYLLLDRRGCESAFCLFTVLHTGGIMLLLVL